jgi:hypothetical protein
VRKLPATRPVAEPVRRRGRDISQDNQHPALARSNKNRADNKTEVPPPLRSRNPRRSYSPSMPSAGISIGGYSTRRNTNKANRSRCHGGSAAEQMQATEKIYHGLGRLLGCVDVLCTRLRLCPLFSPGCRPVPTRRAKTDRSSLARHHPAGNNPRLQRAIGGLGAERGIGDLAGPIFDRLIASSPSSLSMADVGRGDCLANKVGAPVRVVGLAPHVVLEISYGYNVTPKPVVRIAGFGYYR